ncbi:MAG: ribonuclease P protein subunit [Candidatus Methanomethylophilaceae archaeon]|jgi:ribonuclease P protein subunit POP4|nr:ribonuclease P protein subunit [Candidatus Methanomethylophilaceae archaeon]MBP5394931.1 ribonuclease P protein subunit [Candidatus Methanomethylophilaceae archaeon]
MNRSDFMRSEFIGMDVEVISAGCPMSGRIVDETKNTFTVESAGTDRMVPKMGNEFRFTYNGQEIIVRGSEILHQPENRIKKVR